MPISSGAGGRAARLHLPGGANKRTYWPNNVNASSGKLQIDVTTPVARATSSSSVSLINKEILNPSIAGTLLQSSSSPTVVSVGKSSSTSNLSSFGQDSRLREVQNKKLAGGKRNRMKLKRETQDIKVSSPSTDYQRQQQQQSETSTEKYRRIRHISRPSSHSTTSSTAIKYFTGDNSAAFVGDDDADVADENHADHRRRSQDDDLEQAEGSSSKAMSKGIGRKPPSSTGFSLVSVGLLNSTTATTMNKATNDHNHNQNENDDGTVLAANKSKSNNNLASKSSSLFGSLITLGGTNQKVAHGNYHTNNNNQNNTQSTIMKRPANGGGNLNLAATAHFHHQTKTTINQHNGQTLLNPSLSPAFGLSSSKVTTTTGKGGGGSTGQSNNGQTMASNSSTSSSTANLHSLSSLHQQPTTTIISKRFNLKYVKTLIVVLMALDLMITIFVHHFASHDEFSLAFITSSKLRFSTVNLVLSAIWFSVLTGAILFDIYFILLLGCLVDISSFILLLACSTIHFTHRIDYNAISLTSLLLLLFSIIVLHVYLLVIASLTIYLMLAVKQRRKH